MVSNNLVQALAEPTNHVAQAFGARTEQLQTQRTNEEKQRDDDFHKVVQYAGEGLVDEAKYFAQQKGIQVPDQVFSNATFAKGLSLAGSLYQDDPAKAQVFTNAFMNSQGDLNARMNAAVQTAGVPVSQSEREFQNFVRKEQWKLKNNPGGESGGFSLKPGEVRYNNAGQVVATGGAAVPTPAERLEYVQKSVNSALSGGMATPEQIKQVEADAGARWDAAYKPTTAQPALAPSAGLTDIPPMNSLEGNNAPMANVPIPPAGGTAAPMQPAGGPTPQAMSQDAVYATQQLLMKGLTEQQVQDGLVQRGATPERAKALINAAMGK